MGKGGERKKRGEEVTISCRISINVFSSVCFPVDSWAKLERWHINMKSQGKYDENKISYCST